jgi:hypothetical protein
VSIEKVMQIETLLERIEGLVTRFGILDIPKVKERDG